MLPGRGRHTSIDFSMLRCPRTSVASCHPAQRKHTPLTVNQIPHMLYLDHDIILYIMIKMMNIFKKRKLEFSNSLKILWKMEHLLEQTLHFA